MIPMETADARAAGKPVPKLTVVEKTAQAIRAGIREGVYVPGQRLIEADLTRALGVSRGPLREAMWRLAGEGLVRIEPNRGVVVRKLSRDDVRHIYDIREALEGLAARLAAENIDVGDNRARLRQEVKHQQRFRKGNDVSGYVRANEAFHDLIVRMSGNDNLLGLVGQLRMPLVWLQFKHLMSNMPITLNTAAEQHVEVAAAVLEGKPAQAERAMRKHIRESGRSLLQLPDSAFG